MYTSSSGVAPCQQCPVNTGPWYIPIPTLGYSALPDTDCVCNPGYAGAVDTTAGTNTCTKCGTGATTVIAHSSYNGNPVIAPGQSKCTCMPGYYSTDGYAPCTTCPYGSMGSANNGYAATTCDSCMIGYYSIDGTPTATGGCQKCAMGTTNTATGSTFCNYCDVDYYSPTGNPPCVLCVGASTGGYKGQSGCYYALASNIPTLSPAASPAPTIGATRRPTHPTSSPTMSPSLPAACPIGTYSTTGKLPCTPCSNGSTNMYYGSTVCDTCLFGYYGVNQGKPPCQACPAGSKSTDDRTSCVYCVGDPPCFSTDVIGNFVTNSGSVSSGTGGTSSLRKVKRPRSKTHNKQVDVDVNISK